ncbi:MAG: hypothetical protein ACKVOU_08830, partial [Cytophagales bacterium]
MKRFIIFSLLATVLLWHSFALEIKRQNLSDLKNLYQTGEYEEAIKLGVKLYHFNKNTYKIQTAIICSYISLAQYNWYDFENGNYFSSKSLELLSKNRSESQEYVNALLEVVDAHIQRNEWIRADSLLNSISKPTVQANLDNYIKFNLVNANLLKNKGKYLIAIDLLDQSNAYLLASNNEPISKIN